MSSPTLPEERLRDLALQVRLAAVIVREGVEDAERRRPEAHGEPARRGGLLLDEGAALAQERLHVGLPFRLRLDPDQQRLGHLGWPSSSLSWASHALGG